MFAQEHQGGYIELYRLARQRQTTVVTSDERLVFSLVCASCVYYCGPPYILSPSDTTFKFQIRVPDIMYDDLPGNNLTNSNNITYVP